MVTTEIKEIMEEFFPAIVEGLDASYKGLHQYDEQMIASARGRLEGMHTELHTMVENLVKEARHDAALACIIPVITRLEQISRYVVRIATAVQTKNAAQVLLSDKAHKELDYLIERVRDILVHTKDYVLSDSPLGALHVIRVEVLVEKAATESATHHEERLIEGLCMPKASSIFLEILDSLKSIAWYSREIAQTKCP